MSNGHGANDHRSLDNSLASFSGTDTTTSNSGTRNGVGGLTYATVQNLTFNGAGEGDFFGVLSPSASTIFNGAVGNDTLNFQYGHQA